VETGRTRDPAKPTCLHYFLEKNWSKEVTNEKQSVIGRLKEKQSKSTRSADGHKGLALTMGQQVRTIGRWKSRGLVDWHGEGCVQ
jgi:hypothetical protein